MVPKMSSVGIFGGVYHNALNRHITRECTGDKAWETEICLPRYDDCMRDCPSKCRGRLELWLAI